MLRVKDAHATRSSRPQNAWRGGEARRADDMATSLPQAFPSDEAMREILKDPRAKALAITALSEMPSPTVIAELCSRGCSSFCAPGQTSQAGWRWGGKEYKVVTQCTAHAAQRRHARVLHARAAWPFARAHTLQAYDDPSLGPTLVKFEPIAGMLDVGTADGRTAGALKTSALAQQPFPTPLPSAPVPALLEVGDVLEIADVNFVSGKAVSHLLCVAKVHAEDAGKAELVPARTRNSGAERTSEVMLSACTHPISSGTPLLVPSSLQGVCVKRWWREQRSVDFVVHLKAGRQRAKTRALTAAARDDPFAEVMLQLPRASELGAAEVATAGSQSRHALLPRGGVATVRNTCGAERLHEHAAPGPADFFPGMQLAFSPALLPIDAPPQMPLLPLAAQTAGTAGMFQTGATLASARPASLIQSPGGRPLSPGRESVASVTLALAALEAIDALRSDVLNALNSLSALPPRAPSSQYGAEQQHSPRGAKRTREHGAAAR